MEVTTISLPIYIQKNIIKILCDNINRVNRSEWRIPLPNENNNKKEETGIINDLKSLSLINKQYFNTVSNNLTVSVDFISYRDQSKDYLKSRFLFTKPKPQPTTITEENVANHYIVKRLKQQREQSTPNYNNNNHIIKYENIKELVLNIEDWDIKIEFNRSTDLSKLINEAIKTRYINLEKIIIKCPLRLTEFIDFPNIRISTCIIDYPNQQNISNIKEVDNLKLYLSTSTDNYLGIFKSFNQVSSLYIENWTDFKYLYNIFINENGSNGMNNNCFANTKKIMMNKITIESWCYLLKLVPFIQHINIQICVDNLIYQLSEDNKESVVPCKCSSNVQNDYTKFNENWQYIVNTIKEHKYLNRLFISHNCYFSSISSSSIREPRHAPNFKNNSYSQCLFDQFKLMLSSNTSIIEFSLYGVPGFISTDFNSINSFK